MVTLSHTIHTQNHIAIPWKKEFRFSPLQQTFFIIGVCNNQLLNWIENELIWVLSFIPGLASALPKIIAKIDAVKEKYMSPAPVSNIKVRNNINLPKKKTRWSYSMNLSYFFFIIGEKVGFLVLVGVEHRGVAHADELLREDRKRDGTEAFEEATGQWNRCVD